MSSEDPTQIFPKALEETRRRLAVLEEKVAKRGYDTRPLFESHEQQLVELRNRVQELEKDKAKGLPGGLRYKDWAYFSDDGDGPFCRHCYESTDGRKLSHVTKIDSQARYFCTICRQQSRDFSFSTRT